MPTDDGDSRPRLGTLEKAEDFAPWLQRIGFEAKYLGLVGHVTGETACPQPLVPTPAVSVTDPNGSTITTPAVTAADVQARAEEIAKWKKDDDKMAGLIGRHLGASALSKIEDKLDHKTTARGMIQLLTEAYQGINIGAQVFYSFRQLLRMRYEDGTSVEDHITAMRALIKKLAAFQNPISDQLAAFILLESMPETPRWELVREPLLAAITDDKPLTFGHVDAKLTAAVMRTSDETAAKATTANVAAPSKGGDKWCVVHKTRSHSTEECTKVLAIASGGKSKKGKSKGKLAHKVEDTSGEDTDPGGGVEDGHVSISRALKNSLIAYVTALAAGTNLKSIILDSGASACMCPTREWFVPTTFKVLETPIRIRFGDNSFVYAHAKGDLALHGQVGKEHYTVRIRDVLYVPSFKITLISCSKLDKSGYHVSFGGGKCRILKGSKALLKGSRKRGLYELDVQPEDFSPKASSRATVRPDSAERSAHTATSKGETVDINIMHRRLGHLNFRSLKRMVSQKLLVTGLSGQPAFCEACVMGKMKKLPFSSGRSRATRPLEIVHSDVGGPVTPQSRDGFKYWITFIDDHTSHVWVYYMKKKSEAITLFERWKTHAEAALQERLGNVIFSPNYLSFFRSDGGGEYTSKEFEAKLSALGVVHQTTAPDTPEQNGVAERMNQTLVNTATTMLADSKLPQSFWADAMDCAAHMINRRPSSSIGGKTPYEMWYRRSPDARHLHPFGCTAYTLIQKEKRAGKFHWKARKCIMLGYTRGKKDYRLYDIARRTVVSSRHVLFDENDRVGIGGKAPEQTLTEEQWEHLLRGHLGNPHEVPDAIPQAKSAPAFFDPRGSADEIDVDPDPPAAAPVGELPEPAGDPPDEREPDPPIDAEPAGDPPPHGEIPPPLPPRPRQSTVTPPPQPRPLIPPVRKSTRERKQFDKNREYLRKNEEHDQRLAERRRLAEDFRKAQAYYTSLGEDGPDEEFFAGLGATDPNRERDPRSMREARRSAHAEQWEKALNDELEAFRINDVVEEVPLPQHAKSTLR